MTTLRSTSNGVKSMNMTAGVTRVSAIGLTPTALKGLKKDRSYDRISWVMKTVYEIAKHTRQIASIATM